MTELGGVTVQLTAVLGSARVPIRELLKMGRGATIPLDRECDATSELHAAGRPIAVGRILLDGERLSFEITSLTGGAA